MRARLSALLILAALAAPGARAGPDAALPPITVELLPATTVVASDWVGPYAGLAAEYPRLLAYLRTAGLTPTGPAEALYLDDPLDVRPERLRSTACFAVAGPLPSPPPVPAAGVSLRPLPARLVARTVHIGPYAAVRPTYDRLQRALSSLGLRYAGAMREVYLDDPATTAPADLRTDVGLIAEPTAKSDVGLYAGAGADGPGLRSLAQALFAAGLAFRPLTPEAVRAGGLAKVCRCVVVPGGWAPDAVSALGADGARELRAFVRAGGGYVGVCAGAYLATRTVVWEGETRAYPIGLLEGTATGPVAGIAPWPTAALTPLALEGSHPVVAGLSGTRQALYHGGPVFAAERDEVSVLARFVTGGGAALVAFASGKGRVVLSSVHLEGHPDAVGSPAAPVPGAEGADPESDRDLLTRSVRWALGKDAAR